MIRIETLFYLIAGLGLSLAFAIPALAEDGQISPEQMQQMQKNCALLPMGKELSCQGKIAGLDPDGDGFLALRLGPGSRFAKVGELVNGDEVMVWERRGNWYRIGLGLIEHIDDINAAITQTGRNNPKLWAYKKWISIEGVWTP